MTTFYLGYSRKSIKSNSSSIVSSVYNSSDEFQDAERAWDPTNHLVKVYPRKEAIVTSPPASRDVSIGKEQRSLLEEPIPLLPQVVKATPPRHIPLPSNTFMAHGLPTCGGDIDSDKEFDFVSKSSMILPKAPIDFLTAHQARPPSPPYVPIIALRSSPFCNIASEDDDDDDCEETAVLIEDDDYPASNEEDDCSDGDSGTFYVDADSIKAAHESVLDLRALLEEKLNLIPGESVKSLEKRALKMVHLEESFNVEDSFEPQTLLADQDRAFIPWVPVIEDIDLYLQIRYPDLVKGSSRYDFHRARLIRNRTRLRILAAYVAEIEQINRSLCRLSRSL